MRVTVSQAHIDRGTPLTCGFCPLALALQEQTGERWHVIAPFAVPNVRLCDATARVPLPPEATRFIERFDGDLPVEPFSFTFDYMPAPVVVTEADGDPD